MTMTDLSAVLCYTVTAAKLHITENGRTNLEEDLQFYLDLTLRTSGQQPCANRVMGSTATDISEAGTAVGGCGIQGFSFFTSCRMVCLWDVVGVLRCSVHIMADWPADGWPPDLQAIDSKVN